MLRRVDNDAALADPSLADLELRFDEGQDQPVPLHEPENSGNDDLEGNERGIDRDEIDPLPDSVGGQVADVRALDDDDPRVLAELPGHLPVADIHGVDPGRTALQQAVRETAVEAPASRQIRPDASIR